MSPRAACRLEALGFQEVFDYVGGKADWLGRGLPRDGRLADVVLAGDVCDPDPPTCGLRTPADEIRRTLDAAPIGFCLVLSEGRVVLGRVRRSALVRADPSADAESLMEPGPSTVRASVPAAELDQRLANRQLKTAVVTDPDGRLLGVFHGRGHR